MSWVSPKKLPIPFGTKVRVVTKRFTGQYGQTGTIENYFGDNLVGAVGWQAVRFSPTYRNSYQPCMGDLAVWVGSEVDKEYEELLV